MKDRRKEGLQSRNNFQFEDFFKLKTYKVTFGNVNIRELNGSAHQILNIFRQHRLVEQILESTTFFSEAVYVLLCWQIFVVPTSVRSIHSRTVACRPWIRSKYDDTFGHVICCPIFSFGQLYVNDVIKNVEVLGIEWLSIVIIFTHVQKPSLWEGFKD